VIEIGPMSGKSNVIYWLEKRGIEPSEECVNRIYEHAKNASSILAEEDIRQLVSQS
jgi:2-isopropylmalate synthase